MAERDDPAARPRGGALRRVARQAGIVLLFLVVAAAGAFSGLLFAYADDMPEIRALDDYQPSTITRLLARDGRVVGEFATERRLVVGYDEIDPVLRQAIIATEDGTFERHLGINIARTVAAVLRNVLLGEHYGASTITQQVARLLFLQQEYMAGGIFVRSGLRGKERKIKEWLLALQLEKRFTKREIFAFYANQSNLGPGIYGVEAAARAYFGKPARDLTLAEAASIAATFQTPARLSPFANPGQNVARRNTVVLRRMVAEGFITEALAAEAAAQPLDVQPAPAAGRALAPYFAEEIRQRLERSYGADALYQAGLQVQTTLDVGMQQAANAALERGLRAIDTPRAGARPPSRSQTGDPGMVEQEPVVDGAIVVVDNATGEIRAMVGGYSFARSKFNRAVQAERQIGSIFKPIVYAAAIDRGLTPVSIFVDEPVAFDVGPGQPPYSPQNYDRTFVGPITLRQALEQSRNIPAVKAMADLGADQVAAYAARFGFARPFQPFLSTALGAGEATLLDVTSAYSVYPNQGVRMTPYAVVSVTDRGGHVLEEHRPEAREAIRADTAFVVTHLMRGVVQRGTAASAASLNWPLAGKTGTVDDNTDAWFVGFDPDITVGVWVGHDEKRPIGRNETGATAALPIWIDFMRAYIEGRGDRANPPEFVAPGNIVFVTLPSGITEAFISGTQPQDDFQAPPTR
jgi:penicillin-binding protein 1A